MAGPISLALERNRRLRTTVEHLELRLAHRDDILSVEVDVLESHPDDGVVLPATVGLGIAPLGGTVGPRSHAFVELRTGATARCQFTHHGLGRGQRVTVRLQYADAVHDCDADVD